MIYGYAIGNMISLSFLLHDRIIILTVNNGKEFSVIFNGIGIEFYCIQVK